MQSPPLQFEQELRIFVLSMMFPCCVYLMATRAAKLQRVYEEIEEKGDTAPNGRRNSSKLRFDETLYALVQIGGSLLFVVWGLVDYARGK